MQPQFPRLALALALLAGSWQLSASPQHGQAILAQARAAIGGEARLQAVRSLSVNAVVPDGGEIARPFTHLHLDFLLPDKFLVSIERAYFMRVGGYNSKELIERRQVDGRWADLRPASRSSDAYTWQMAARRRECALYLVAWLLGAPAEYGVEFTEVTAGESADPKADILDAKGGNDLAVRLYFDKITHRLVKLAYQVLVPTAAAGASKAPVPPMGPPGEPLFKGLEAPEAKPAEATMEFSGHHGDDGILFPHKIRIESEGLRDEWQISRFKVNPPLDVKYFERK
jgi:hypothetical protein